MYRVLGIVALGARIAPLLLASLPAAAVGILVRIVVEDPGVALAVGVPLVVAVHSTLLFRFGISPQDRAALRELIARVGRMRRSSTPVT